MKISKISPFLWFNHEAEEAAQLYTSIFKNGSIVSSNPLITQFELEGQTMFALNTRPETAFTDAISIFVNCEDQAEVDHYWNKFLETGGSVMACGWLKDKFGVAWQIIPQRLMELMNDKDKEKADRVMQAMMKMDKIIVADLEKAYEGAA